MWNRKLSAIILTLTLLLITLSGCNWNQEQAEQASGGSDRAATVNSPAPVSNPTLADPLQAAEAEKWFQQGLQLYEQGQYRSAASIFDKAIAADPANYKIYTAKGIALCFAGDYQPGVMLIQKTLDMKPDYLPAFYDMAMACKLQKNYDQSLLWFEKTIQGDPGNTWSYYGIATIYADRAENTNSLVYLRKAIELDPSVKDVARRQSHFDRMRSLPEFQALTK